MEHIKVGKVREVLGEILRKGKEEIINNNNYLKKCSRTEGHAFLDLRAH